MTRFRLPIFGPRTITETVPGITPETALAAGTVVHVVRWHDPFVNVRAPDGYYCVPQKLLGCPPAADPQTTLWR